MAFAALACAALTPLLWDTHDLPPGSVRVNRHVSVAIALRALGLDATSAQSLIEDARQRGERDHLVRLLVRRMPGNHADVFILGPVVTPGGQPSRE
jgi:hypothetical protein